MGILHQNTGDLPYMGLHQMQQLERYLKQIKRIPLLSKEEEQGLSERIKHGDGKALEKLVVANLRFVIAVAHAYKNQGLSLTELVSAGNVGLIKAANNFDGKKNFRFISYAVWSIRQAILCELSRLSRIVKLPTRQTILMSRIEQTRQHLQQRYSNSIAPEDIGTALGISAQTIYELLQLDECDNWQQRLLD